MSNLIQFDAAVEIQAAAGDGAKQPRVSILAYAGGLMSVGGWGLVVIDLAGLKLPAAAMPLLVDHNANIDGIAGSGTPSIHQNQLTVGGTLAPTSQAAQKLIALSKAGVSFGASVGVEPTKHEFCRAGTAIVVNGQTIKSDRDFALVRSGKLREVSILSVPADSTTYVSIAAGLHQKGKQRMSEELFNGQTAEEINAEMKAALPENNPSLTMMERVESRWNRTRWHDTAGGPRSRAQRAMISAAAGKINYEQFENELLQAQLSDTELKLMQTKLPQGPMVHASSRDLPDNENRDVMQAALLCHMGYETIAAKSFGDRTTQAARDLRLNSLHDILRCALHHAGQDVPHGRTDMIKAASSTNIGTYVLSNVANKISMDSYKAVPSVARMVSKKLNATDFKSHTGFVLDAETKLEELGPDGEIKHGHLNDRAYTYRISTYAKMFGLSRQDIINDDLHQFDEIPRLLGRGAANTLEKLFWTLVLANTGSFFSADNLNYQDGAGSALGEVGLGVAVELMRKQVDVFGDPIMVTPKYLVLPPEKEIIGDILYASKNLVGGSTAEPEANPFYNKYQPLTVPHLSNSTYTGNSADAWYLFADPNDVAAFGIAYLDGVDSPIIEQKEADFNQFGWQFRGYMDFGITQIDKKGAVKSKGTT